MRQIIAYKKKRKVFIVLSGAQGSGKTTLTRNLNTS